MKYDRSFYEGHFLNDFIHGIGRYRWTNGDSYEGEYQYNQKHGTGIFRHASGETYIGEYKNGKRYNPPKNFVENMFRNE